MPFDGSAFSPLPGQTVGSSEVGETQAARHGWLKRLASFLSAERWTADIQAFVPVSRPATGDLTVGTVLTLARALIDHEDRWIKGHYATLDGRHCAVGAVRAAALRLDARRQGRNAQDHLRELARAQGFRSIEQMNDHSTHAEVIGLFDRAIETADRRTPP